MATTVPIADGQRIGELERFYPQISRYALTLHRDTCLPGPAASTLTPSSARVNGRV